MTIEQMAEQLGVLLCRQMHIAQGENIFMNA